MSNQTVDGVPMNSTVSSYLW